MITYRQALELLPPGDTVYCTNGKATIPAKVVSVEIDHLVTDEDILCFEEHGELWWLTEKEAAKAVAGITKEEL